MSQKISKERKQFLEKVLKREKHKALLIKNFKAKYGISPSTADVIRRLVEQYVKSVAHITETTLAKLDAEISQALTKKPTQVPTNELTFSPQKHAVERPKTEVPSSEEKKLPSAGEEVEREWAAIFRFNNALYQEELKREREDEKKKRERVKDDLEKQMSDKKRIEELQRAEEAGYDRLQEKHLANLDKKAHDKELKQKQLREEQKKRVESELAAERERKRLQELEERRQDQEYVQKVNRDLKEDARLELEKRRVRNEYMRKVIAENEKNRQRQLEASKLEKQMDTKALEEYAKVLEKQEQDRVDEVKRREARTQQLMVRLANTVIKEMDKKQMEDELKMLRHQQEKDMQDKTDNEARLQRIKDQQRELRRYLEKQMDDQRKKDERDRQEGKQQATMWRQEVAAREKEDRMIAEKTLQNNKQYQEYLKKQMEGSLGKRKDVLTKEEFLMNRNLFSKIEGST